jgi:hypothetical protein
LLNIAKEQTQHAQDAEEKDIKLTSAQMDCLASTVKADTTQTTNHAKNT